MTSVVLNTTKSELIFSNYSSTYSKKYPSTCLLVFGFLRLFIETQFSCIIPSAIKFICCEFYGYAFSESDILQSNGDQQALYELLSSQLGSFNSQLIFQSTKHGCTNEAFYNHCNGKSPTLVLIESNFGNVFGGYTTVPWAKCDKSEMHAKYSDEHSFLFVFKVGNENDDGIENENDSETKICPKIFPIKKSHVSKALYMYPIGADYIFHFGSSAGIAIRNKFSEHEMNFCYGKGWTYDEIIYGNELCGIGKILKASFSSKNPKFLQCRFCAKKLEVFHTKVMNDQQN